MFGARNRGVIVQSLRRDKVVAQFQKMISEKGENEVLY